jgi:hypothetical protein
MTESWLRATRLAKIDPPELPPANHRFLPERRPRTIDLVR